MRLQVILEHIVFKWLHMSVTADMSASLPTQGRTDVIGMLKLEKQHLSFK